MQNEKVLKSEQIGITVNENRTQMKVENIKCDGCGKTITAALKETGLENIVVDVSESSVEFDTPTNPQTIVGAKDKLSQLGYPLVETAEGLKALALKVKSYLSCAIGKMN